MKRYLAQAALLLALLQTLSVRAQQAPSMAYEQIVRMRVGSSFDAQELAYFGLFSGSSLKVDSARLGIGYLERYSNGQSSRVPLTSGLQQRFYQYIAQYEQYALDSRDLDPILFQTFSLRNPLVKYEHNGRFAEITLPGQEPFYGELAFVTDQYIGLYLVDLGYDVQIAETEMKIFRIENIDRMTIYSETAGRYIGLGLGVAAAGGLSALGLSVANLPNEQVQIATNFILFPAVGFGIGYLLDQTGLFKSTYNMRDLSQSSRALVKARRKVMFPNILPPEIKRRVSPTP